MKRMGQVLAFLALGSLWISVQSAGFDCQKARTFVEKAICDDVNLSVLDEELVSTFNTALVNSHNPKVLKKQQLQWLKTKRDVCQTNACLEQVYKERIAVLRNMNTSVAVSASEYVRYDANDKPDYHAASVTIYQLQGKVKVVGASSWVGDATAGNVNSGSVEGIFDLHGDQVHYKDNDGCEFLMLIGKSALTVSNDNGQCGGMNVTFNGYYKKVK